MERRSYSHTHRSPTKKSTFFLTIIMTLTSIKICFCLAKRAKKYICHIFKYHLTLVLQNTQTYTFYGKGKIMDGAMWEVFPLMVEWNAGLSRVFMGILRIFFIWIMLFKLIWNFRMILEGFFIKDPRLPKSYHSLLYEKVKNDMNWSKKELVPNQNQNQETMNLEGFKPIHNIEKCFWSNNELSLNRNSTFLAVNISFMALNQVKNAFPISKPF